MCTIGKCPNCGYSLVGLPLEHRCPECGFEYDRDSVLFAEPRVWWKALLAINAIALVVAGVLWVWHGSLVTEGLFLLPFVLMLGGWVWHLRAKKHYILVSPKRIRVFGRGDGVESYPMLEVGGAKWDFVTGDVVLLRPDGTELTQIKRRFLASNIRSITLARTIRGFCSLRANERAAPLPDSDLPKRTGVPGRDGPRAEDLDA